MQNFSHIHEWQRRWWWMVVVVVSDIGPPVCSNTTNHHKALQTTQFGRLCVRVCVAGLCLRLRHALCVFAVHI